MQTITLETRIAAPAMRVFLLSLSVDLHTESTKKTDERAIAGVTRGVMKLNDEVTWKARHFGFNLQHTSRISRYDPGSFFEDVMVKGMFASFKHEHLFHEQGDGTTIMTDVLYFESPLGLLGGLVDQLVLRGYLTKFLCERNRLISEIAETNQWQRFLPANSVNS